MIDFLAFIVLLVLAIAVLGAVLPAESAANRADRKRAKVRAVIKPPRVYSLAELDRGVQREHH